MNSADSPLMATMEQRVRIASKLKDDHLRIPAWKDLHRGQRYRFPNHLGTLLLLPQDDTHDFDVDAYHYLFRSPGFYVCPI